MRRDFLIFTSLVLTSVFMVSIVFSLARPYLAFYVYEVLNVDVAQVALLTTAFMLGRATSSLISGYISDLIKRREFFILLIYGVGVITFLYAFCNKWVEFIILRLMQGLFAGMSWPVVQLIIGEASPPNIRSRVFAIYFASGDLGISFGYLIYSYVYEAEFKLMFIILGLSYVTSLTPLTLSLKHASIIGRSKYENLSDETSTSFRNVEEAEGKDRVFGIILVVLITLVAGFTLGTMREFFYIFAYEFHGLSKGFIGKLLFYSTLLNIAVSLAIAHITDVFGMKKSLLIISLISSISLLLITMKIPVPLLALFIGSVLAMSKSVIPLSRSLMMRYVKTRKGLAIGFINSITNLSVATFPVIAGYLYEIFNNQEIKLFNTELSLSGLAFIILSVIYLAITVILLTKKIEK